MVNGQLPIVNAQQSTVGSQRFLPEAQPEGPVVFVYIIECADKTLYTGWTTDIERRLKAHNAGRGARYTQQRRPVRLVYLEELPDRRAAQKRELEIKRLSRTGKLKLVQG
jgi:putative endonuclease